MGLSLKIIKIIVLYALAAAVLLVFGAFTSIAHARSIHIETGFGRSAITNTDPFFGVGGPATANAGFGTDIGLYAGIYGNALEFQLGLQNRLSSGSGSTGNYLLNVPYGVFRIQLSRIFVGVGYSPFIYRQSNNLPEAMTLSSTEGATSMMFEGGILFPITPLFSAGGKGAVENVTSTGTAPSVLTISLLLRFYFDISGNQGNTSSEFKGWRYPFGRERF